MKEAKKKEKQADGDPKKVFEIREKNRPLTALLKNKIGQQQLEKYPQEVEYYLTKKEEKKDLLTREKKKIEEKIGNSTKEKLPRKLARKNDLETRIAALDQEQQRHFFPKYLSYITNNERL